MLPIRNPSKGFGNRFSPIRIPLVTILTKIYEQNSNQLNYLLPSALLVGPNTVSAAPDTGSVANFQTFIPSAMPATNAAPQEVVSIFLGLSTFGYDLIILQLRRKIYPPTLSPRISACNPSITSFTLIPPSTRSFPNGIPQSLLQASSTSRVCIKHMFLFYHIEEQENLN